MFNPKIIAFYLPQYHPIKENNEWYGEGFTEWTNVGKAKPLFKGHYQPHIPADLGYYDLRLPEIRESQAKLAKEAGINAFCYYHYWFGNNKTIMEWPLQQVIKLKTPDFPFCVCWANHSFYRKTWNNDSKKLEQNLLLEQTYPGEEDFIDHFNFLLPTFIDSRYFKIDDKLVFVIYDYISFKKHFQSFKKIWNDLAVQNGLNGFFFIGYTSIPQKIENGWYSELDAVIFTPTDNAFQKGKLNINYSRFSLKERIRSKIFNFFKFNRNKKDYQKSLKYLTHKIEERNNVFPVLIPNWDTTPRRGYGANMLLNSTPELFREHVKDVLDIVKNKPTDRQIIFIRSWNEWGEGNYMEPDIKFGKGYIQALNDMLKSYKVTINTDEKMDK